MKMINKYIFPSSTVKKKNLKLYNIFLSNLFKPMCNIDRYPFVVHFFFYFNLFPQPQKKCKKWNWERVIE